MGALNIRKNRSKSSDRTNPRQHSFGLDRQQVHPRSVGRIQSGLCRSVFNSLAKKLIFLGDRKASLEPILQVLEKKDQKATRARPSRSLVFLKFTQNKKEGNISHRVYRS